MKRKTYFVVGLLMLLVFWMDLATAAHLLPPAPIFSALGGRGQLVYRSFLWDGNNWLLTEMGEFGGSREALVAVLRQEGWRIHEAEPADGMGLQRLLEQDPLVGLDETWDISAAMAELQGINLATVEATKDHWEAQILAGEALPGEAYDFDGEGLGHNGILSYYAHLHSKELDRQGPFLQLQPTWKPLPGSHTHRATIHGAHGGYLAVWSMNTPCSPPVVRDHFVKDENWIKLGDYFDVSFEDIPSMNFLHGPGDSQAQGQGAASELYWSGDKAMGLLIVPPTPGNDNLTNYIVYQSLLDPQFD